MEIIDKFNRKSYKASDFGGNIPPLITPVCLDKNGEKIVDLKSFKKEIGHIINHVDGIFLLGTAGESPTIPSDQFDIAVSKGIGIIRKKKHDMPVLVGVSADNIDEMIRRAKFAEENGADALVLVPLFGKGNEREKLEKLLKETNLPVVLYNNPGIHTDDNKGKNLSADFVRWAKENEKFKGRVIGIKSTSDPEILEEYLKLQEENIFHILQGGANVDTLHMNVEGQKVKGIVSFEAVISPKFINFLLDCLDDQGVLRKLSNLSTLVQNPQMVKTLLTKMRILTSDLMF